MAATHFELSEPQLAAAIALAGLSGQPGSRLPALAAPTEPLVVLKDAVTLVPDGQTLHPELREALSLAATPKRALAISAIGVRDGERSEARLHDAGGSGPFALLWKAGDIYCLLLAGDVSDAVVSMNAWMGGTFVDPILESPPRKLSFPACAALLAAADAWSALRLRAQLAARTERKPVLNSSVLERAIHNGTRPAAQGLVAAASGILPLNIQNLATEMSSGLAVLQREGFIGPIPRGMGFTPSGEQWIGGLAGAERVVSVSSLQDDASSPPLSFLFGAQCGWILEWPPTGANGSTMRWITGTRQNVEQRFAKLLQPTVVHQTVVVSQPTAVHQPVVSQPPAHAVVPEPNHAPPALPPNTPAVKDRFCTKCGRKAAPNRKFCQGCGAALTPEKTA